MAATIIERTISGSPEKAIQLNNAQFGRLVGFPSNWAKLRVGLRLHMTDSGANLTGTPRFAVGLGRGTTNMVGDASCDHWVGAITSVATWSRSATQYSSLAMVSAKKVGATLTTGGSIAVSGAIDNQAAAAAADRNVYIVDITKGSPNFTVNVMRLTGAAIDFSSTAFLNQQIVDPCVFANHAFGTGQTIAVDEGVDGVLNGIQVWWNHSDALIEICDVAVTLLL